MMSSRTTTSNLGSTRPEGDQGIVTLSSLGPERSLTVSGRAGRLLFALLLSSGTIEDSLSMLANVPKKLLPACVTELTLALETQEQSPDPNAVGAEEDTPSEESITHLGSKVPSTTYPTVEPESHEDAIAEACRKADQTGDLKAQALAVVDAWRFLFPKLANHEEVARKQDLSPRKAREWIELVKPSFPGREATTVFGWLSGVDEGKLLSVQFPLAWVSKMVVNKAQEAKPQDKEEEPGDEVEVMDAWRNYARNLIEKGEIRRVGKNIQSNLERIASRVQASSEAP